VRFLNSFAKAFTILVPLVLVGCATVEGSSSILLPESTAAVLGSGAQMIPTPIPMPVRSLEIWDATQGKRVEKDVLALTSSTIRDRLTATETFITVEKRDMSGALTYLGAGGKVSRGSYRVTFDFVNYTNQSIQFAGAGADEAVGRLGVGLRITADLETSSNQVDLSGLIPIGLAAQEGKVSGQLRFLAYGLSNPKLNQAVPSQSILDVSSIQKSFEAAAAVRILFGLDETRLEPYLIGVANVRPSQAKGALDAASRLLKQ
jgi:hypothetical protein